MVHMQEGHLPCVALHYHDDLHTPNSHHLHIDKCNGDECCDPSTRGLKRKACNSVSQALKDLQPNARVF